VTLDFVYTAVYTGTVSAVTLAANVNRAFISPGRNEKTIEPVFDSQERVMALGDKVTAFKYRLSVYNMNTATQSVIVNVSTYPRRCYRRRTARTESNSPTPTTVQQSIAKLREEKFNGWTYEMPIKLSVPEWSALRRLAASRNMTAAEFIQFHLDSSYVPLRVAIQQFEQKAAA